MVPRVAGPSPRLGRVLGPLGRGAEALGSSDTAAARPPGTNGNYRSGPRSGRDAVHDDGGLREGL